MGRWRHNKFGSMSTRKARRKAERESKKEKEKTPKQEKKENSPKYKILAILVIGVAILTWVFAVIGRI